MEFIKENNEYGGYDINLIKDNLIIEIQRSGQDYNINAKSRDYSPIDNVTFTITPDEGEIYYAFLHLYLSITEGNPLGETLTLEKQELNKSFGTYQSLVSDGVISYKSDALPLDCPDTLNISKSEEGLVLNFNKTDGREKHISKMPFQIRVHIRMSGGRYYPYCIPFNTLYKGLQDLDLSQSRILAKEE